MIIFKPYWYYALCGALWGIGFALLIGMSPAYPTAWITVAGMGAVAGLYLGWLRRRGWRWGDIGAMALVGILWGLFSGRNDRA
jgi:hypothetical protein